MFAHFDRLCLAYIIMLQFQHSTTRFDHRGRRYDLPALPHPTPPSNKKYWNEDTGCSTACTCDPPRGSLLLGVFTQTFPSPTATLVCRRSSSFFPFSGASMYVHRLGLPSGAQFYAPHLHWKMRFASMSLIASSTARPKFNTFGTQSDNILPLTP